MEEVYDAFLIAWLAMSGILTSFIGVFVYWAIKNRQFSNQDKARRLPLTSGIPDTEEENGITKNELL